MTLPGVPEQLESPRMRYLYGLGVWALGWLALLVLDGPLDLSGLGMVLVLTSAVAALWLPVGATLLLGLLAVMAFNWTFVPPRGTFSIDLQRHAAMLVVMFTLNGIVAALMSSLRSEARHARMQALAADKLRGWADILRDAGDAQTCVPELQALLQTLTGVPVTVLVPHGDPPRSDDMAGATLFGAADAEQLAGLWYCLRDGHALGPASGRFQDLNDYYLPFRGRNRSYGAAMLRATTSLSADVVAQGQDLCDQMGTALERKHLQMQQEAIGLAAREQELRATLLAAIAHDYRTPLATIMGAASSLRDQDGRLSPDQRHVLTIRIVDEVAHLRQMTTNILQLARLDTPRVQLRCDWEAPEELVGGLTQRFRSHTQAVRLHIDVEPRLPLLWCDPMLIAQLLDNLVDNAFKYSALETPIHVGARRAGEQVVLFVRDEGPGIPQSLQAVIFEPFRQGRILPDIAAAAGRESVGIGLALCRVIAAVHEGELRVVSTPGGSNFECLLPVRTQPQHPAGEESGA